MLKVFILSLISASLVACIGPGTRAPVSSRSQPPSTKVVTHRVAPGETLYAIAWRYGLDYRGLARANSIAPPYTIFVGQTLSLKDRGRTSSPAQKRRLSTTTGSAKKTGSSSSSAANTSKIGKIDWRWPATGSLLTRFNNSQNRGKGIDIDGQTGDPVVAAASGEVVYAGSGLRSYGNLVIIKHNNTYLSAYAHNQRLRVGEGESVRAGQRIADLGSSGTGVNGTPKLHFQIRRNGKPVNPISLLPKRNS